MTCPIDAIEHDDTNVVVNADICDFCMECIAPCPTGSIDNWRVVTEPYSLEDQYGWDELPEQEEFPAHRARGRDHDRGAGRGGRRAAGRGAQRRRRARQGAGLGLEALGEPLLPRQAGDREGAGQLPSDHRGCG